MVWNSDTTMQVVDKLIIFCPHISSKKEKNGLQMEQMFKDLENIKKFNPEFDIICAGDFNS